ncbi:MAG: hypothetical protein R3324_07425, partial [Halobacteriales archaeon]|nr:hypothetical protein [Halobacteriales archaeon]
MDGEPWQTSSADNSVADEVSEAVETWISETAAELGVSREELIGNLLTEVRHVDADGTVPDVSTRIDALEDDMVRKIEDVRDRVVQVKLETDEKAPAGHEHPELQGRLEQVASATKQAADQIDDVQESLENFESRTESGFANYETILNDLVDTTQDVEEKLNTLAAAVLNVRESVSDLE